MQQPKRKMKRIAVNKALLPAKAAYFFFYFSYSSVTPYIPVFMTAYGLNAEQAGFVLGARLFSQFFSGPLWGAIADKTRKYKFVLLLQIVISSILTFTAPYVPMVIPKTSCGVIPKAHDNSTVITTMSSLAVTTPLFIQPTIIFGNQSVPMTEDRNAEAVKTTDVVLRGINSTNSSITTEFPSISLSSQQQTKVKTNKVNDGGGSDSRCKASTDKLFTLMIIWFALIGAFDGGIPILIDNSVIDTIEKVKSSDFGKQRLWGAVGFGLAAFASGVGIELSGSKGPNYFTMFYIFLGSNVSLFISCCFLDMSGHQHKNNLLNKEREKKPNLTKGLIKTFRKFNVSFFFLTVLIMGIANGLLYGFMFLYIQDLKGSKIIMGLSILVACSTEVIMFPISNSVIKLLRGNLIAIALSFAMYTVRFLGFSVLQNAWYILLLQLLHSVCFALFWNATVYHTSDLAPKGMKATLLGIMNGVFFGIAGGSSSLIGGILYKHFGGRNLFRGYAIICGVWTVFMILHILERKKHGKLGNLKDRKNEDEDQPANEEQQTSAQLLSENKV